jgi:hypothetical protein
MKTPQINVGQVPGHHNRDLALSTQRLQRGKGYRNCNTVILVPAYKAIPPKVVQSWMNLMTPMNQMALRIFMENMEVGDAYTEGVKFVLGHQDLKSWPYLLTLEHDNMPPPDGLLKLIESIEGGVDGQKYDAMGGLYWTKGEGGQPMIYGDPHEVPLNFRPQIPQLDTVQRCNGLGMGFTLFRISAFEKVAPPWFKTLQEYEPGRGGKAFTQDLYFFSEGGKVGLRFACDTRVKVGHYDYETDTVW